MTTTCLRKRCCKVLLPMLLLIPLAAGCGGGQAKGTVSGKVTYRDKPLPSGIVTFIPETGAPVHADIQGDGSYRMSNAPLGPVKIGVQTKSAQDAAPSSPMPRNPTDYGKLQSAMMDKESLIPAKYTDPNNSGLTYTVTKGKQQHDIDLK